MMVLLIEGVYEVRKWDCLFSDPENGGDMFFRIIGWFSTKYIQLYIRRQKPSFESYVLNSVFSLTTFRVAKYTASSLQRTSLDSCDLEYGLFKSCRPTCILYNVVLRSVLALRVTQHRAEKLSVLDWYSPRCFSCSFPFLCVKMTVWWKKSSAVYNDRSRTTTPQMRCTKWGQ